MASLINCVYVLAFIASQSHCYERLNKFINHFEVLDDQSGFKQNSARRLFGRRSTFKHDNAFFVKFKAFGRTFKLILSKDREILTSNAEIMDVGGNKLRLNSNAAVVGNVDNDDMSQVYGWLTDTGLFNGVIKSKNETYYIEPAGKYFKETRFASIIYRSQDILHSLTWELKTTQNSGLTPERASESARLLNHRLKKRASTNPGTKGTPNICRLSLEADYTFLNMSGSRLHAIRILVNHIQGLNEMFSKSFVSNGEPTNGDVFTPRLNESVVQFQISRVRVYNETETSRVLAPGSLDASTFHRLMQEKGAYSQYCLALFFTARSFTEGVLGVAHPGGACKSLNSGVVSFTREGMVLPSLVTEIAVAHVVGHAFGAKHDPNRNCQSSSGKDGAFIMTRFGLNADNPNNFIYSACSVQQMKQYINTIAVKQCLEQFSTKQSLCGNGVVENIAGGDGIYAEECDCGDEEACRDLEPGNCCDYKTCKLRNHAVCGATNGFCCDANTCSYKTAGEVCSLETECSHHAVCSGNTSTCPEPSHKQHFLECNRNTSICVGGVCSGKSVCEKFGLKSCFCERKMDECKVCCFYEDICRPVLDIAKIKSKLKVTYLSAGSLCRNRKGYCDVFHECHAINLDAPFSHRYDPYFRKKGIKEITHSFWWAIFLGTVGLIASIVLLVKHGALYTRSSSPELNELEPAKALPRIRLTRLNEEEKGIMPVDDTIA